MAAPRVYKTKRLVTFNSELETYNELEDIAYREKKSFTDKLNELMIQEVERARIVQPQETTSIGINYSQRQGQQQPLEVEASERSLDDIIIMIKKQPQRLTKVQDLERYLKALELVVPEVRYKLNLAQIEAKSGKSIVEMRRERLGMKPVQSSPIYQERQQQKQQFQRYIERSTVAVDEREEIIEDEEEVITE